MSGTKPTQIEDEQRRRQEAMRREAEERERQARLAARRALDGALAAVAELRTTSEGLGLAALSNKLDRWVAPIRQGSAAERTSQQLEQMVREVDSCAEPVRAVAALITSIPADARVLREAMADDCARAETPAELSGKAAGWRQKEGVRGPLVGMIERAHRAMKVVGACRAASVPLGAEIAAAVREIEEVLGTPTPDRIGSLGSKLGALRIDELDAKLDARRQAIERAAQLLSDAEWRLRFEEWRAGLSVDLSAAVAAARAGDWGIAGPSLRELDDLFAARARHRVEVLREGAARCGMTSTPLRWDEQLGAYCTEIHDAHGEFALVRETPAHWWDVAAGEDEVDVHGPQGWDAPACLHGGWGAVLDQLRSQGVRTELRLPSITSKEAKARKAKLDA